MTDTAALTASRHSVRDCWYAIRRLKSADTSKLLDQLDALCADLTARIEAAEPQLPFVRAIPIASGRGERV